MYDQGQTNLANFPQTVCRLYLWHFSPPYKGISNLEDGCYAKLIDLDKEAEPIIAAAMSMEGTVIENVPRLPGL